MVTKHQIRMIIHIKTAHCLAIMLDAAKWFERRESSLAFEHL